MSTLSKLTRSYINWLKHFRYPRKNISKQNIYHCWHGFRVGFITQNTFSSLKLYILSFPFLFYSCHSLFWHFQTCDNDRFHIFYVCPKSGSIVSRFTTIIQILFPFPDPWKSVGKRKRLHMRILLYIFASGNLVEKKILVPCMPSQWKYRIRNRDNNTILFSLFLTFSVLGKKNLFSLFFSEIWKSRVSGFVWPRGYSL